MRLGLDLDGVVFDFETPFTERLKGCGAISPSKTLDDIEGRMVGTDYVDIFQQDGLLNELVLMDGVKEFIDSFTGDIAIVTKRTAFCSDPTTIINDTETSLAENGIRYDSIHFLDENTKKSSVRCDLFIDDMEDNIKDVVNAGMNGILFGKRSDDCFSLNDWYEVRHYFEENCREHMKN